MPRMGSSRGSSSSGSSCHSKSSSSRRSSHNSSSYSSSSRHSGWSGSGNNNGGHIRNYHRPVIVVGSNSYHNYDDNTVPSAPLYYSDEAKFLNRKRAKILSICCIVAIVLIFVFTTIKSIFCPTMGVSLNDIKSDFNYYHAMIESADEDEILEGAVITFVGQDEWSGKYYFEYEYEYKVVEWSNYTQKIEGFIYSVFTEEDLKTYDIKINKEITIAVDEYPLDSSTDSVPVMLKYFTWEDDGDVGTIKKWKVVDTIFGIADACLLIGALIFSIIQGKKIKKIEDEYRKQNPDVLTTILNAKSSSSTTSTVSVTYNCSYCGSILSEKDTTCKNCGASRRK